MNPNIKILDKKDYFKCDTIETSGNMALDISFMHEHFGLNKFPMNRAVLKRRIDFLQEELDELKEAFDNNDAEKIVDALIDINVVSIGTLDLCEVNVWQAWDEVYQANLKKLCGLNPNRPDSEGMDLYKPEGWVPPDHSGNIGNLVEILLNGYKENEIIFIETRRYALDFLETCKEFMMKKAADYNSPYSSVKSADYYPRGLDDLFFNLHEKYLRFKSVLDVLRIGKTPNFDTLEDTLRDWCIFSAMTAEFINYKMDGQKKTYDLFGRLIIK